MLRQLLVASPFIGGGGSMLRLGYKGAMPRWTLVVALEAVLAYPTRSVRPLINVQ